MKPVLRLRLDLTCFIDVLVPTHLIKPLYHKVNNKNECEICACSLPLYTSISLEKTLYPYPPPSPPFQHTMILWQALMQVFVLSQDILHVSVLTTLYAHYTWNINSKHT